MAFCHYLRFADDGLLDATNPTRSDQVANDTVLGSFDVKLEKIDGLLEKRRERNGSNLSGLPTSPLRIDTGCQAAPVAATVKHEPAGLLTNSRVDQRDLRQHVALHVAAQPLKRRVFGLKGGDRRARIERLEE
jgi:hypothetical protein